MERAIPVMVEAGWGMDVGLLGTLSRALYGSPQVWASLCAQPAQALRGCHRTRLMHSAMVGNVPRLLFYLECGARVQDVEGLMGFTAAHFAALHGEAGALEELCSWRADPCALDLQQRTPLLHAAQGGHLEAVQLLCGLGLASRDGLDARGCSAMSEALRHNHAPVVLALLNGNAPRRVDAEGRCALYFALHALDPVPLDCLRALVRHPSVNLLETFGPHRLTAVMLAIKNGARAGCEEALPQPPAAALETLLEAMEACRSEKVAPPLSACDASGYPALAHAVASHCCAAVYALCARGASFSMCERLKPPGWLLSLADGRLPNGARMRQFLLALGATTPVVAEEAEGAVQPAGAAVEVREEAGDWEEFEEDEEEGEGGGWETES